MPNYRLIFPVREGTPIEETQSAHIDSGDEVYGVGAQFEYRGKLWQVTQAPLEQPDLGQTADLMVWPVE